MLPHGLHGAVAPAISLLPQLSEGSWGFGPGPRVLLVDHTPPSPAQCHGQVGVLGEGVIADQTDLHQRLAPEGPNRAGNRRHTAQYLVKSPIQVESYDVLDMLPACDDAVPVADLDVPGDRADSRIREWLDEQVQSLRLENRVAVDHHDEVMARPPDTGVERGWFAPIGFANHSDVGQAESLRDLGGVIGRSIVDHDHLDDRMMPGRQRSNGRLDSLGLVVGRHDHRNRVIHFGAP